MKVFSTFDCISGRGTFACRFAKKLPVAAGLVLLALLPRSAAHAQASSGGAEPIAIVPMEESNQAQAKVVGALQVTKGTTFIMKSGTVTSGNQTTNIVLPRRGVLRVCASTALTLSADSSVPAGETAGLMLAMDHGAIEASFAAGHNADVLITPDLRIVIGGPGSVDMKVRLGQHGDTCVDNAGANAPYVLVSSVFEGGAYRVQPGQRVMFQHGSLHEVVDQEKEPCGCPASARPGTNDFPLDQSAGFAPLQIGHPEAQPKAEDRTAKQPELTTGLAYPHGAATVTEQQAAQPPAGNDGHYAGAAQQPPAQAAPSKKGSKGLFKRIGGFFKRVFGAE